MSQLNANAAAATLTIAPGGTSWPKQVHLRGMERALKFTDETKNTLAVTSE